MPEDEPDTLVRGVGGEAIEEREDTIVGSVYLMGEVIGRGGMGEVVLAHDRRINRDVAIKRLKSGMPSEEDVARFLREARIQARLDHPAIVPVYELGKDEAGRPFFTMKRVAGVTLGDLLASPMRRLLRAFADVCRAIDFAHTRGVVHRDLKPGNIVVGEFGDVYVLDWGVARVVEDAPSGVVTADIDTIEGSAPSGFVLGTPGYMAPEQLVSPEVGRAADVYALGSILFEVLAGEPLHPRGQAAIQSTLGDPVVAPAKRRADRAIAPELDSLCAAMLARDPTIRPTARRAAERIEEFLDGDRDHERRRTLAVDLVWTARAAIDDGRRADAMRAAGRALALDPETPGAAELVTTLMLEPPTEAPPELEQALREADAAHVKRRARTAAIAYLAMASFLPIAAWNGIKNWSVVLTVFWLAIAMTAAALLIRRKPNRSFLEMVIYGVGNGALLVMISRMAGPYTFVPALACFMVFSMGSYPAFVERPWFVIVTIAAAFLAPLVLEMNGLLATTWHIEEGRLISHAGAIELHGSSSATLVIAASVATIVVAGIHGAVIARTSRQATHRLVTQTWHLKQLLPR